MIQECNGLYADIFTAWPRTRRFRRFFEWLQSSQYIDVQCAACVTEQLAQWVRSEAQRAQTVVMPNGVNTKVFSDEAPRYPRATAAL